MNYLAELVTNLSGSGLAIQSKPGMKEDAARTMSDPSYLIELIGEKPQTKLEEGISETLIWSKEKVSETNLFDWVSSTK